MGGLAEGWIDLTGKLALVTGAKLDLDYLSQRP